MQWIGFIEYAENCVSMFIFNDTTLYTHPADFEKCIFFSHLAAICANFPRPQAGDGLGDDVRP